MQQEFEINQKVMFKADDDWKKGIIKTIFTNSQPKQYVIQTINLSQKVCVDNSKLMAIETEQNESNYKQNQLNQPLKKKPRTIGLQNFDFKFQTILSQLIQQKNEDVLIEEINQLLKNVDVETLLTLANAPKILYTTYQFLLMRKPSIIRNYPFASTNIVLNKLKKLISKLRKAILKKHNLLIEEPKKAIEQSPKCEEQFEKVKKLRKFSCNTTEESEKEEQPTAFYEHQKSISSSAFRPYKPVSSNVYKNSTNNNDSNVQIGPNETLKHLVFKPIILLPPKLQLVV